MSKPEIVLIYDEESPVCRRYCRHIGLNEDLGRLRIVNARDDSPIMRKITSRGLDMDQGIVLNSGHELYSGAEALHWLALNSSREGLFNRLNYWLIKSRTVSTLTYPLLMSLRNILLKILGKTKINNLRKVNDNLEG